MPPSAPNAVFYFTARNYRADGNLIVGRETASAGFLRGFIRHGGTDSLCYYADSAAEHNEFITFVKNSGGQTNKVIPHLPMNMGQIANIGTLLRPGPGLGELAWLRRHFNQRLFSLSGITHTLSDVMALDAIGDLLVAPVQPWDALVCTSKCAHSAVLQVIESWADYLEQRFSRRPPSIHLPIIPLGVDAGSLSNRGKDTKGRAYLRQRMNIGNKDLAILYAGRLNHVEKANPIPMLLAAEIAQRSSKAKLHLIQAGQAANIEVENAFKHAATMFAPNITHHIIDGRISELYDNIWAAADIFISLSDNIQESFGLTPVEAMAAGLPCVVSDWNGYRDTVRNGKEGITIPTVAPPPGAGEELSFLYGAGFAAYPAFIGATSQSTAVDPTTAAQALIKLVKSKELRQRMGEAGRKRAAELYDWRHVVKSHQNLWLELSELRKTSEEVTARLKTTPANPLRPDPFDLFRAHPTTLIGSNTRISRNHKLGSNTLDVYRNSNIATPVSVMLLSFQKSEELLARIPHKGSIAVSELTEDIPLSDLVPFFLTLGWLAKMGLLNLVPDPTPLPAENTVFGLSATWKNLITS